MVRSRVASGDSLFHLSKGSINSIPSAWIGSNRPITTPRRWTPIQFSPLASLCNFDAVQSLPVTPVPPGSPTFSEPPPVLYSGSTTPILDDDDDDDAHKSSERSDFQELFRRPVFNYSPATPKLFRKQVSESVVVHSLKPGAGLPLDEGQQQQIVRGPVVCKLESIREGLTTPSSNNQECATPSVVSRPRQTVHRSVVPPIDSGRRPRTSSTSLNGNAGLLLSDQSPSDAVVNAEKSFAVSNKMQMDTNVSSSSSGGDAFTTTYATTGIRGPTFKATAKPGQTAVWTPRSSISNAAADRTVPFSPLEEVQSTKLMENIGMTPPPMPPPPMPLPSCSSVSSSHFDHHTKQQQQYKKSSMEEAEMDNEARSSVVVPETQSVAALRNKIQLQLDKSKAPTMANNSGGGGGSGQQQHYRPMTNVELSAPLPKSTETETSVASSYDSWSTLNRTPPPPSTTTTTMTTTATIAKKKKEADHSRNNKDAASYQHHWYKMMFKKLHQIDKDGDEKSVMHYRLRDRGATNNSYSTLGSRTPPAAPKMYGRQFLSPEPMPIESDDAGASCRFNRSKSVGRQRSPSPMCAAAGDAKSVGFRHQPGRIEDYVPGHSSITTSTDASTPCRSHLQTVLDNSQHLLQRILGDLSREVEQRKTTAERIEENDDAVENGTMNGGGGGLSSSYKNRPNKRRERLHGATWSLPVCCVNPGSKLYALERSKTFTFHLPPFRVDRSSYEQQHSRWKKKKMRGGDEMQRRRQWSVIDNGKRSEGKLAYEAVFEHMRKVADDIQSMTTIDDESVNLGICALNSPSSVQRRHSISSCSVPFCGLCSVEGVALAFSASSSSSVESDFFYLTCTAGDDARQPSIAEIRSIDCNNDIGASSYSFRRQQKRQTRTLQSGGGATSWLSEQPNSATLDRCRPRHRDDLRKPSSRAKVLYSFVAQNPRELDLEPGDAVTVRRQIDANWCEGEVNGRVGIFPTNYVEFFHGKEQANNKYPLTTTSKGRSCAKALYDFVSRRPRELSLKQGEVVHLIREVDKNWTLGFNEHGQEGLFPSHYVKPCLMTTPIDNGQFSTLHNNVASPQSATIDSVISKHSDQLSRLVIDGIPYQSNANAGGKSDSLDAILNEMKHYSSSLSTDSKSKVSNTTASYRPAINYSAQSASKIDTYEAMFDYAPENADELELKRGDIVYVVENCDDGWFVGTSLRTGRFGTFPGNYVKHL